MVDLVAQNQITVLFKHLDTESMISVLLSLANTLPDSHHGIELDAEVGTVIDAIGDLYKTARRCEDTAKEHFDPDWARELRDDGRRHAKEDGE